MKNEKIYRYRNSYSERRDNDDAKSWRRTENVLRGLREAMSDARPMTFCGGWNDRCIQIGRNRNTATIHQRNPLVYSHRGARSKLQRADTPIGERCPAARGPGSERGGIRAGGKQSPRGRARRNPNRVQPITLWRWELRHRSAGKSDKRRLRELPVLELISNPRPSISSRDRALMQGARDESYREYGEERQHRRRVGPARKTTGVGF